MTTCHLCGEEKGSFEQVEVKTRLGIVKTWQCLAHRPKLGYRRRDFS